MIKRFSLKSLLARGRGFTLVEMLVALSIAGVLGSGVTMAISQVMTVSISSKNQMNAVKQVENALHYVNRDAQMAYEIEPTEGHFPLSLTWNEWELGENDLSGPQHQVTYSIVDNKLERVETVGTDPAVTSTVASYIENTSECTFSDKVLTVTLTAYVGGFKPATETRTLEVRSRPEPLALP
jgi:prepilin-type N-terminal cleavage/methylation domain-containing protein